VKLHREFIRKEETIDKDMTDKVDKDIVIVVDMDKDY